MSERHETLGTQFSLGTFEAQRQYAEDAPPLCVSIMRGRDEYVVMSVADGMGGAGRYKVRPALSPDLSLVTMAQVAARNARGSVVSSLCNITTPKTTFFLADRLSRQLILDFPPLVDRYVFGGGGACRNDTGKPWILGAEPFPTTLAATVVNREGEESMVHMMWGGDSTLSVLTLTALYTTLAGPDLHNAHGIDANIPADYRLHHATVRIPEGFPFMVVASTDGLTKFRPPIGKEFKDNTLAVLQYYKQTLYAIANLVSPDFPLNEAMRSIIAPFVNYDEPEVCYRTVHLYPDDLTASAALYDPIGSFKDVDIDRIVIVPIGNGYDIPDF